MHPGEQVLPASRMVHLGYFAFSASAVAVGIWMWNTDAPVTGALITVFFAVCSIAFLVQVIRPGYLRLTDSGFEVRGTLRNPSQRWDEVDGFYPLPLGRIRVVGYSLLPVVEEQEGSIARWRGRRSGVLPGKYRNMSANDLADLMNAWLDRSQQ